MGQDIGSGSRKASPTMIFRDLSMINFVWSLAVPYLLNPYRGCSLALDRTVAWNDPAAFGWVTSSGPS